ncbi:Outer membrane porin protein OmpD precursor [Morganella morganii]|nr:Outer membrane porin protein OmpD precursor [Morganella morganii]
MTLQHGPAFCHWFGGDTMAQTDVYMTGRNANLLTYRNTDFFGYVDGLSFALPVSGC